jgi:energy-coupling factor transporter ATP-binding protein EcfA2
LPQSIIEFRNFSFRYAGARRDALRGVNLSIQEGEVVALVGPSGCGKSTLLRSIIGLIPHMYRGEYSGSVIVDGMDVARTPVSRLATRVGYIFQNPENQLFMFTVRKDIAFGLENLALPRHEIVRRVDWAMKTLGIEGLADTPPHELSDGQKQRVAIAGVLAMKPKVLILDEPTSLLDPVTAESVITQVKELHDALGITLIIAEHRLDLLVTIASRFIVLDGGRVILDGPAREVLGRPELQLIGVNIPAVAWVDSHLRSGEELALTVDELADRLNNRI